MKILISKMSLRNFKGIRKLDVRFGEVTNITGQNATGKTTIFDAFTWLLFGKNSGDAKDFNIKTLDNNNNPLHRLEHEVTALLVIDGKEVSLKRIFREKWVKKRGSQDSEFTGHETEFFIDDVPLSLKEYQSRVDFYINENLAKLITNPLYFNQMKWNDRRGVLESMSGTISDAEILDKIATLQNKDSVLNLTNIINSGKKLEDYKREIGAKKKKIKDELVNIPTRIDELNRTKPEPKDYSGIEKQIETRQQEVKNIDASIEDKSKEFERQFEIIRNDQEKLNKLKIELGKIQSQNKSTKENDIAEIDGKIRVLNTEIENDKSLFQSNAKRIVENKTKIEALNSDNDKLRAQWNTENAKELIIDDHKYNCPTCKQLLPEQDREKMRETLTTNFNTEKARKLKDITVSGQNNKNRINELEVSNKSLEDSKALLQSRITDNESKLSDLKNQRSIVEKTDYVFNNTKDLEQRIKEFAISEAPKIDNEELKSKKKILLSEIDSLKTQLSERDQGIKIKSRIAQLTDEESKQSQELADLERTEFAIEAFSKAKVEEIESRINGKFSLVKFKMFEQQVNGGEVECCECMVDGVPYSDVNTAGKINAGIDIINALTQHYNISAPVFIDNRESVIRILPCKSQIINLIAVKDAPLTVTAEEMETAELN